MGVGRKRRGAIAEFLGAGFVHGRRPRHACLAADRPARSRSLSTPSAARPAHQAFAAYARALIKPVADRIRVGRCACRKRRMWAYLRDTLLRDLSRWGDQATIDEARRRFAAFVKDPHGLSADAQATLLAIVGQNADAATFAQLHTLAKGAKDDTFLQRCYVALARVRDPQLARQVVQIALSDELPPQANTLGLRLFLRLAREHPRLSWDTYIANQDQLMKSVSDRGTAAGDRAADAGRHIGMRCRWISSRHGCARIFPREQPTVWRAAWRLRITWWRKSRSWSRRRIHYLASAKHAAR